MKVKRLDHVGVIVDDLDETARLLTGQLGLVPESSEDRPDLRIAFFEAGGARVELIEPVDPDVRARRLGDDKARIEHLSFEVDDLDETLRALQALGIETTAPPRVSNGNRNVWTVAATSSGIVFQFQQPN
jgi:catechol 2,3-dioxygenase-like lactoylglutathione lyase family enzyme